MVEAAYQQMLLGSNFTRPGVIEVECAQKFLGLSMAQKWLKFAKNGSDVTTAAVKLAELLPAVTWWQFVLTSLSSQSTIGSSALLQCLPEYQRRLKDLTVKFHFNDISSLENLFAEHSGRIACVIMEPETAEAPNENSS